LEHDSAVALPLIAIAPRSPRVLVYGASTGRYRANDDALLTGIAVGAFSRRCRASLR